VEGAIGTFGVQQTMQEEQVIRLTVQESCAFALAVLQPREPPPRLKAAARRFMQTFGPPDPSATARGASLTEPGTPSRGV
jgi:uncharacterized protein DUF1778